MLGEHQLASLYIHLGAGVSCTNAGETTAATWCRKLIYSQASVLITGKVKTPSQAAHGLLPACALLRACETQSTMTVLIQLFSTM